MNADVNMYSSGDCGCRAMGYRLDPESNEGMGV